MDEALWTKPYGRSLVDEALWTEPELRECISDDLPSNGGSGA